MAAALAGRSLTVHAIALVLHGRSANERKEVVLMKLIPRKTCAALLALHLLAGGATAWAAVPEKTISPLVSVQLNRAMTSLNDNRDPNWDWTTNATYTLQTHSQTFTGVRLPYYSNSGPAAALLNDPAGRDIAREDGWVLVLRDFGPVAMPFFILYNKYRGILRIFFFSTLDSTFSSAVGRLSFQTATAARSGAHFTLSERSRFLDSYDPARSQVSIGAIQPQQWGFFDFDVSGYDPGIGSKDDPTFVFEIAGVTQSDLTATGEVNLVTGPVSAMANMRPGSSFVDSTFNVINNVNKRHASVVALRKTVDEQVKNAGSAWWAGPLKAIQSLTNSAWLGALGPVAGFLETVLGGGSRSSTLPAPMATEGTISLRGQISTQTSVYTLIFRVPGGRHLTPGIDAQSNVLPLYDTPLGLLNVRTLPAFDVTVTSDNTQIIPTCPWQVDVEALATTPLQVDVNPFVFASADIRATFAPMDRPAERFVTLSNFNASWTNSYAGDQNDSDLYLDLIRGFGFFDQIALRATLTPAGAAVGLEPVRLYKVYDVLSEVQRQYSGFGGCGGGWGL